MSGLALGLRRGVDLATGKITYQHVNGTMRDLSPIPLLFKNRRSWHWRTDGHQRWRCLLSGTLDYFARAYDVATGKQLRESRLPAGGQSTPMTYWFNASNRQFVVVVAGGHGPTGTEAGDAIIAYALPES